MAHTYFSLYTYAFPYQNMILGLRIRQPNIFARVRIPELVEEHFAEPNMKITIRRLT